MILEDSELQSIFSETGVNVDFQTLKAKSDKLNIGE